jgi:hypothetical protein
MTRVIKAKLNHLQYKQKLFIIFMTNIIKKGNKIELIHKLLFKCYCQTEINIKITPKTKNRKTKV